MPGHFNYSTVGAERGFHAPHPSWALLSIVPLVSGCLPLPGFGALQPCLAVPVCASLHLSVSPVCLCLCPPTVPPPWETCAVKQTKVQACGGRVGLPCRGSTRPRPGGMARGPHRNTWPVASLPVLQLTCPLPSPHLETYLKGVLKGASTVLGLAFIHFHPEEDTYLSGRLGVGDARGTKP